MQDINRLHSECYFRYDSSLGGRVFMRLVKATWVFMNEGLSLLFPFPPSPSFQFPELKVLSSEGLSLLSFPLLLDHHQYEKVGESLHDVRQPLLKSEHGDRLTKARSRVIIQRLRDVDRRSMDYCVPVVQWIMSLMNLLIGVDIRVVLVRSVRRLDQTGQSMVLPHLM